MDAVSEGKTPVAVCVFNRPDHASRLMACIAVYRPTHVLVIADGARDTRHGEAALCQETRARILSAITWPCHVQTCFSDTNMGCGLRISSGLDWVFSQVEEAIILEDDCLPNPSFFAYCDALLDRYRDVPEIMHIGGYRVPFRADSAEALGTDYGFSGIVHIWGWATWRRAWQRYDFHLKQWPEVRSKGLEIGPLKENRGYWTRALDTLYAKKPHTWDHQWSFACWVHGGLAIVPVVNLVQNIGFSQGAHGARPWNPLAENFPEKLGFPLRHPAEIKENPAYSKAMHYWVFSRRRYLWYLLFWAKKGLKWLFQGMGIFFVCCLFWVFLATVSWGDSTRLLEWFYRGNTTAVIRYLENKPLHAEDRLLLANAYFKAGKFASAENLLQAQDDQTLEMQPFVSFLKLQLAVEKKELPQAQKHYATIVRLKGDSDLLALRAEIEVARCLVALAQRAEAALLLRSILRKTENPEIMYGVHQTFFKMALAVSDKLAAQNALKAICLTGVRVREESSFFRQFRLRFGEDVSRDFVFFNDEALVDRGNLLVQLGLFQDAVNLLAPWLLTGVSDKSTRIRGQYLVAQTYYLQAKYPQAIDAFQQTLSLADVPSDMYWPAHMRLAECLLRIQDYAEALRYIQVLQAGPMAYRAAGHALYIRYLIALKHPVEEVLGTVYLAKKESPKSPELNEVAMDAWYDALSRGYSPMPDPPMSLSLARFFSTWRPKHIQVSPDSHILEQLPLGYTTWALLEASVRPGVMVAPEKKAIIRAGFGQLLLAETTPNGDKEDMAKAKVLHLMARPYQSITRLRSRLMMAPRDAELWKNLDEDWIETLFPRIMMGWVTKASQKSGLEPSLILSVIRMESTFNTEIKSRAGASGLMQLMPMTARHVAQHLDIRQQKDEDLLDPETNVMLGSFYLAQQMRTFKGSLVLALAAYNAGPTTVRRWITLNPELREKTGREQIALLPYSETRRYVSGVLDGYVVYSFLEKKTMIPLPK